MPDLSKFRKFTYTVGEGKNKHEVTLYLQKDVVRENSELKTSITWYDDFKYLASRGAGMANLAQTLYAAALDNDIKKFVYSWPAEWKQLFLNPNTKSESRDLVLLDAQGNPHKKTGKYARSILPISITEDNGRKIITAEAHDIPFDLKNGKYNPKDIDLASGFLTKLDSNGEYTISFADNKGLYAVILLWNGGVGCGWGPARSSGDVGFRGSSTGNIPAELIETEKDVLGEKIDLQTAELGKIKGEIDNHGSKIEKLEADYKSKLEELKSKRMKLADDYYSGSAELKALKERFESL